MGLAEALTLWMALAQCALALPSPDFHPPAAYARLSAAALPGLSDEELLARARFDPSSLGPLSIGVPSGGRLLNAVELSANARLAIAPGALSWGTEETMADIRVAIDTVHELFPDTAPLFVGDISNPEGGRLKRHETHQAGRDVDFGFYYLPEKGGWYAAGTNSNLDLPRNWALVRALVTRTDVERILVDRRIQKLLYRYALDIGEDKEWLDRLFQVARGGSDAIVRHVTGHRTHYHVRFFNPVAQEAGRRAHPFLVQAGVIPPPIYTITHVVRRGQTLGHLARRYGVSSAAIKRANGLRTSRLRAGRAYRIPVRAAAPPAAALVVPPRLLPPYTPEALAAFDWPTAAGTVGAPVAER